MFITKEEVVSRAGRTVEGSTLALAQTMIETWIGKDEAEVSDGGDRAVLAKATMFQAIYLNENPDTVLEQAGVVQLSQNESVITFNTELFAPFMSPWAVMACKKLSWMGTRSVHTAPINRRVPADVRDRWVRE